MRSVFGGAGFSCTPGCPTFSLLINSRVAVSRLARLTDGTNCPASAPYASRAEGLVPRIRASGGPIIHCVDSAFASAAQLAGKPIMKAGARKSRHETDGAGKGVTEG